MLGDLLASWTDGKLACEQCFFCRTASVLVPSNTPPSATLQRKIARASAGAKQQHGCDVVVSSGDGDAWFCAACECWNGADALEHSALYQNGSSSSSSAPASAGPSSSPVRADSSYKDSPFCRTCERNQALVLNLLSQDASADEAELDGQALQARYAAQKRSFEQRYPPVCEDCAPLVEQRIRMADQDARRRLMGGWLARSRPSGDTTPSSAQSRSGVTPIRPSRALWKLQGALWGSAHASALLLALHEASHAFPQHVPFTLRLQLNALSLPLRQNISLFILFQLCSLGLAHWNPRQGPGKQPAKLEGLRLWKVSLAVFGRYQAPADRCNALQTSQSLAWSLRLIQVSLSSARVRRWGQDSIDFVTIFLSTLRRDAEQTPFGTSAPLLAADHAAIADAQDAREERQAILALVQLGLALLGSAFTLAAYTRLRAERPVYVRLATKPSRDSTPRRDPHLHQPKLAKAAPAASAGSFSFSKWGRTVKPASAATDKPGHVFGETSLPLPYPRASRAFRLDDEGEDSMDWQSEAGEPATTKTSSLEDSYIGPQRYFPPEEPTGLEDLFGSALALASDEAPAKVAENSDAGASSFKTTAARLLSTAALTTLSVVFAVGVAALAQIALLRSTEA